MSSDAKTHSAEHQAYSCYLILLHVLLIKTACLFVNPAIVPPLDCEYARYDMAAGAFNVTHCDGNISLAALQEEAVAPGED